MQDNNIPNKLTLSANDPFLRYLSYIYNSGIDCMEQANTMLNEFATYKSKLDDHMVNTKLDFMLSPKDSLK